MSYIGSALSATPGAQHAGAALLACNRSGRQQASDAVVVAGIESVMTESQFKLATEMARYDKHMKLKKYLTNVEEFTNDELSEMLDLPTGLVIKDFRKLRIALAEALLPESNTVTPLVPNPFAFDQDSGKWNTIENCESRPTYEDVKLHYEIHDKKPQLLTSIFGLRKATKMKSSTSSSSSNSNDPHYYQELTDNEKLTKDNQYLQEQIRHAQLMQTNNELIQELKQLTSNSNSKSRRHHHHKDKSNKNRSKRGRSTDHEQSENEDSFNEHHGHQRSKSKRHKFKKSNRQCQSDDEEEIVSSEILKAQQSLDDID